MLVLFQVWNGGSTPHLRAPPGSKGSAHPVHLEIEFGLISVGVFLET